MDSVAGQWMILLVMQAGTYTCAAAGTVLIYDILITAADEMELIWLSQFSLPKCLYFANRYFPVPCLILAMYHLAGLRGEISTDLFVHLIALCKLISITQLAGQQLSLTTATWLLVIRVGALYKGKRSAVQGLYTLFISTHLTSTVLSIIVIHDVWDQIMYSQPVGICLSSGTHLIGVVYLIPVLCDVVLVIMQLVHAHQHTKQLGIMLQPLAPLMRTLYVDGFAYFVVVVTLRLWSALTFIFANPAYWYISVYLEFSLISIAVSRLVLHLREAAVAHRSNPLGNSNSMPLSELATKHNPNVDHWHEHAQDHSWDSRYFYSS